MPVVLSPVAKSALTSAVHKAIGRGMGLIAHVQKEQERDESGRFASGGGGGGSAAEASQRAHERSAMANEGGWHTFGHQAAGDAHREAEAAHLREGNTGKADEHARHADEHDKAEAKLAAEAAGKGGDAKAVAAELASVRARTAADVASKNPGIGQGAASKAHEEAGKAHEEAGNADRAKEHYRQALSHAERAHQTFADAGDMHYHWGATGGGVPSYGLDRGSPDEAAYHAGQREHALRQKIGG